MVKDLLICFLVQTKKLKFFEAKLKNENIEYSKEKNDNWYNFRFNEKNIEIIKYYILYYKLIIQNEHFFIIDYFRLHKKLTNEEKNEIIINERKRFGKYFMISIFFSLNLKLYQLSFFSFKLVIQNEHFFIIDYFRLHKKLTDQEKNEIIINERKRFGK